jgi:hypothetical protein
MSPLPRYKAAALAVALLALPGAARAEKKVAGAILPDDAVKIGENRFRVRKNYEDTLKFYRVVYGPKHARKRIIDTAAVKAVHIVNPEATPGQWDGLNVYEFRNETRIFVLVRSK